MPHTQKPYRTQKEEKRSKILRFLAAFISFTLIFFVAAVLYVLYDNDWDVNQILGKEEEVSTTEEEAEQPPPAMAGETTLLLATRGGDDTLFLLCVAQIDLAQNTIFLSAVPTQVQVGGKTLQKIDEDGGISQLQQAIESHYGIAVTRYIAADGSGFKTSIDKLGGLELTLEEPINHRGEFTLFLPRGTQVLRGDNLYKYMQYQAKQGDAGETFLTQAFAQMVQQYLTQKNIARGTELYRGMIDNVESNITAMDFASAKSAMEYLVHPAKPFVTTILEAPYAQESTTQGVAS